MSKAKIVSNEYLKFQRFAFATLLALTFCAVHPAATAYAVKPKKAKYGTIKILTTPGNLPISVDGKSYGQTSTSSLPINLDPGLHTIVISLPDGQNWTREINLPAGRIKCVALNYRPSPPAIAKSPCPFPIDISAPKQVNDGEIITYAADATYSGTEKLIYKWQVSPANVHIISGAGTQTVTVDSTGLAGQRIVASLVVDNGSGDSVCRQTARAATDIPQPPKRDIVGREFDTCRNCSYDDQKARLDNLAVELQNDLSTTSYLMAYGGRKSHQGQADHLLARARDYLVTKRGIDAVRIVLVNGGFREDDNVEVWIVPRGASPPQPSPTVQAGDVRQIPSASKSRSRGRS